VNTNEQRKKNCNNISETVKSFGNQSKPLPPGTCTPFMPKLADANVILFLKYRIFMIMLKKES
jgi:hypothetical protein